MCRMPFVPITASHIVAPLLSTIDFYGISFGEIGSADDGDSDSDGGFGRLVATITVTVEVEEHNRHTNKHIYDNQIDGIVYYRARKTFY